jgi:predicted nicotinamide N-methyase
VRLKYRKQAFDVGDTRITLRIPTNLRKLTDEIDHPGVSRDAFPLIGIVWNSAEILCRLLEDEAIANKKVLELGCGMALASHFLNARGADITAMDIHPVTRVMLEANVKHNEGTPIPFVSSSWGDHVDELGEFDLIIASDILYEPRHVKTLAAFHDRHAKTLAEVLIVDPDRGQADTLKADMEKFGFECESFRPKCLMEFDPSYECLAHRFRRKP